MSKMSMCQFAVPLLLPCGQGDPCTLMVWAMRDIVKRWRPQSIVGTMGFKEDCLVNISIFSFVRLGKCSLSKSKILNRILNPTYMQHNFFVHQEQKFGYNPKEISEKLVEMACYFPVGRENTDIFPEPVAFLNLRGEVTSTCKPLSFLARVSSGLFVFVEDIKEEEYNLLQTFAKGIPNIFLIICPADGKSLSEDTKIYIKKFYQMFKLNRKNIVVKDSKTNESEMVKKMQNRITNVISDSTTHTKILDMVQVANDRGIKVDEGTEDCQKAQQHALQITKEIKDTVQYKKDTMKLQSTIWKQVTKNEKELCRMREQGESHGEKYRSDLIRQNLELRRNQNSRDFLMEFGNL
ncbi:hypothetical protein GDO86_010699 [Hymenochirus boettgeri]|uniref:Up-regulator of cell proliferation-like domain-containing protein n=1 Tax=Hymenochirus boettgeri TaxID=247094 RepID=A0A8T2JDK8_9PIPI|nr:hypothetical protein GDO86_010699 [Hymenochirus boettgeri]